MLGFQCNWICTNVQWQISIICAIFTLRVNTKRTHTEQLDMTFTNYALYFFKSDNVRIRQLYAYMWMCKTECRQLTQMSKSTKIIHTNTMLLNILTFHSFWLNLWMHVSIQMMPHTKKPIKIHTKKKRTVPYNVAIVGCWEWTISNSCLKMAIFISNDRQQKRTNQPIFCVYKKSVKKVFNVLYPLYSIQAS